MKQDARLKTYAEFWPFYLGEHSQAGTRALHFLGTLLGLGLLAAALVLWDWRLLASALVTGYGFAWLGHAFIERNRPATFRYPLWSFLSDHRGMSAAPQEQQWSVRDHGTVSPAVMSASSNSSESVSSSDVESGVGGAGSGWRSAIERSHDR